MGLIKALTTSTKSILGDQFKEFVECPEVANDVIIQRGIVKHGEGNKNPSEGIITNGSTIAVPQGMAMMIVDNGKIAEFTAEPGTYTWDTSSEPSIFTGGLGKGLIDSIKTLGKRITYGGQTAKEQRVYYVNIKLIPGQLFGSRGPIVIADPIYGSVEVTFHGEYAIRVDDPAILINNVVGSNPKDTLTFDDIFTSQGQNMLKMKFTQKIGEAISKVMTMHNVSFTQIQNYLSDITDQMNQLLDTEWKQKYGIIIEDVALSNPTPSEESREIIREMDKQVSTIRRVGQEYSNNMAGTMAAATAEAMKTAAGNESTGPIMSFMGMNMANMTGNTMMGTVAPNSQQQETKKEEPLPEPGTLFAKQEETITSPQEEVVAPDETLQEKVQEPEVKEQPQTYPKFCTGCGNPTTGGNFCGNCGTKLR